MSIYHMSEEEAEYLKRYDITKYDRPSVATDIAVFSIMGRNSGEQVRDSENYRKLPEKKIKILLIKRANYPYKDCWALPGGFCQKNEDVYETASRELYEETYVKHAYLELSGIFGEVDRDPRGWVISHTFLALIDGMKCKLRAGTDAWEAKWFDVELQKCEKKKEYGEDTATIENEYTLRLVNGEEKEPIELTAVVKEHRKFKHYHEKVQYELKKCQGFAFDHAKIIVDTFLHLQKQVETDGKIVFDLMPEAFTLTELQKAFEVILDKKLTVANFRRKMADYVVETDEMIEGAGHRPAKLFKRNLEMFYK